MPLFLLAAASAPATVPVPAPASTPWPAPPFAAWVSPPLVYVRHEPKVPSELAGALRRGDRVQVRACQPACDAPHAWAVLAERGSVPLSTLRPLPEPDAAVHLSADATFTYARVAKFHAPEYAEPDTKAKVVGHQKQTYLLAFLPDPALQAEGWLRHATGGYMRVADLTLSVPSKLQGEHDPQLPLAFVRRAWRPRLPNRAAPDFAVHRYDRLPVRSVRGDRVEVAGGSLPRNVVRVIPRRALPDGVPTGAQWIYVDLDEQTLTAYQGTKPVFATLVSTGRAPHPTKRGTFRLYTKTTHSTMRGRGWADYVAEEVQWVMHFYAGQAFHAATWHDQFGIEKSHGCINLAPADAAWLFAWVPPQVPAGWHTLLQGTHDPAVWLVVGGRRPAPLPRKTPELSQGTGRQWGVDLHGALLLRTDAPFDGE